MEALFQPCDKRTLFRINTITSLRFPLCDQKMAVSLFVLKQINIRNRAPESVKEPRTQTNEISLHLKKSIDTHTITSSLRWAKVHRKCLKKYFSTWFKTFLSKVNFLSPEIHSRWRTTFLTFFLQSHESNLNWLRDLKTRQKPNLTKENNWKWFLMSRPKASKPISVFVRKPITKRVGHVNCDLLISSLDRNGDRAFLKTG